MVEAADCVIEGDKTLCWLMNKHSIASTSIGPATWYAWGLTGFYLYSVNLQGNVVPFLQAEFALSYRAVSLHSSAIAVGIILVGLLGDRVEAGP